MMGKSWKEMPIGAVIPEPGSSEKYNTGEWRAWRPVFEAEKCVNCMLCWVFCPDSCILVKEEKMVGIDYDHCKGCGICAHECPTKALEMKPEYLFREED
ncbi:pyruvate synthase subunit PorD [Thermovibrio sp.]